MATNTTNYNLIKPALTDAPPDITVMNPNWDKIDEEMKKNADNITASVLSADITIYVSTSGNDTSGTGTAANPYKTINKAVSTVPKNLGGHDATIHVAGGTYNETVTAHHFGNGRILMNNGTAGTSVTVTGINLLNAHYFQVGRNIDLSVGTAGIVVDNNSLFISAGDISITGAATGVIVNNNAHFNNSGSLVVNNATTAAIRVSAGQANISTISGAGNTIGLLAVSGGVITITSAGNLTATTKYSTTTGGRIYSGAQTSIPNY